MDKICFILPYFGTLPNYFSLWLKSCEFNTTIDWLIFTDNNIKSSSPNIKIITISFNEFKNIIQKKFDFKISLEKPYKLCDFKPTYGYIFSNYLQGYDFWGHCDADIIWGNIRHFLNNIDTKAFDKIFIHGHCTLYRNVATINTCFRDLPSLSPNYTYDKILSAKENYAFDEFGGATSWGGINKMFSKSTFKQYYSEIFDDISIKYKNFYSCRPIKGYEHLKEKELVKFPIFYKFDRGKLERHVILDNSQQIDISETMYIHLQKRKMKINTLQKDSFYIVPNSFEPITTDLQTIINRSKHSKLNIAYYLIRLNNLNRKIKKLFTKNV